MRMAGPDIVLFVVGALLFGGASYAIVLQGGLEALREPTSSLGQFTVSYTTSRHDHEPHDVANFRQATQTFDVNETNVSRAFILIDCVDGQASTLGAFTLQIQVESPGNVTPVTTTSSCTTGIEVEIPVADVPADTAIAAHTLTEAEQRLQPSANATAAFGTWTVTITGARAAGGLPLPDPAQQPPTGSIAIGMEQWRANFAPVQGR